MSWWRMTFFINPLFFLFFSKKKKAAIERFAYCVFGFYFCVFNLGLWKPDGWEISEDKSVLFYDGIWIVFS